MVEKDVNGTVGGTTMSDSNPAALGTAAPGVSANASRADHVHSNAISSATLTSPNVAVSTPASPASGATMFAKTTGRTFPAYRGPNAAFDKRLQAHMINVGGMLRPAGFGSSGISVFGFSAAPTAYDTAVASGAFSTTDYRTIQRRVTYASGTGANAIGGWRTSNCVFRSSTAGWAGFYVCMRFAFAAIPAQRWAAGIAAGNFTGAAEPSASVNWVGVGQDSTDGAFIQFMTNDGSGAATKTASTLATPTTADVYELNLYSPANSSSLYSSITNLRTGVTESTTHSSDLPTADTAMQLHAAAMNMATGVSASVDLMAVYVEHDI